MFADNTGLIVGFVVGWLNYILFISACVKCRESPCTSSLCSFYFWFSSDHCAFSRILENRVPLKPVQTTLLSYDVSSIRVSTVKLKAFSNL